jgi:hypothetical protein
MKTLILVSTFSAMVIALSTDASMSSAEDFAASKGTITVQSKPRFSSRYTSLTGRGCGSGMTKAEEREAEERGTDLPTRCKGPGGYSILVGYSACSAQISAEKGSDSYPLIMQSGDFKQNIVEWRMAQASTNAKPVPFAVIMRKYEYAGNDLCATGGKVTAEFLIVKGLEGFEHIDEKIDVKTTPNPNLKARQLADQKYGMSL